MQAQTGRQMDELLSTPGPQERLPVGHRCQYKSSEQRSLPGLEEKG